MLDRKGLRRISAAIQPKQLLDFCIQAIRNRLDIIVWLAAVWQHLQLPLFFLFDFVNSFGLSAVLAKLFKHFIIPETVCGILEISRSAKRLKS